MSVLLFVVGAIAVMVGVAMVGYGIPINEFSFGNTLIVAGTTAAVGGLIVIAIGAAVAQLQRIGETLATRAPVRSNRPLDMFEAPAAAAQGRVPFPAKPNAPASSEMPAEDRAGVPAAPTLRNPEAPAAAVEEYEVAEYDEVSLSPQHQFATPASGEPARPVPPRGVNGSGMAEKRPEPAFDAPWRSSPPPVSQPQARQPQTSYFDSMWPADSRAAKRPISDEFKPELPPLGTAVPEIRREPETHTGNAQPAILKSGVVDGMGYTLYVDGSIEAELPQGTLRFASINELRSHLTKNA